LYCAVRWFFSSNNEQIVNKIDPLVFFHSVFFSSFALTNQTNQKKRLMEQTTQTPQGKGMGVAGFVISLVALVLYIFIAGVVALQAALGGGYGLGIFWLVLSLLGTLLSVMGMMKLGKTGGKKGLAITGMILGIVSTLLSAWLVIGIGAIQEKSAMIGNEFKDAFEQGMNQSLDSLQNQVNNMADSMNNAASGN
jgi:hypothetical protein